jgi:hypothetical protein
MNDQTMNKNKTNDEQQMMNKRWMKDEWTTINERMINEQKGNCQLGESHTSYRSVHDAYFKYYAWLQYGET